MHKIVFVNLLTFLRIAFSLVFGYSILKHSDQLIFLFIIFSLVCATDYFDGRLARNWRAESREGAIFDVIADMFFVFVSYIALILVGILPIWILAVAVSKFLEFCITSSIAAKSGKITNLIFLFDKLGKLSAVLLFILPMIVIIMGYCLPQELTGWIAGGYTCVVSLMACISSAYRIGLCSLKAPAKAANSQ